MSEMSGRPLGSGYLLEALIGAGAMGQVWRAHGRDGSRYAIKVLRSDLTADASFVARFLQEAQILKRVSGPNLVSVCDLVAEGTTLGIVMDLVDGADLRRELAERGTLPARDAAWVVDQILAGLASVHAVGIVHRDIKPENVLLDRSAGRVIPKITDFGIARIVEQGPAARSTVIAGTPEYMAPELADGQHPTPQSDLYAVGILLYELLCGVTPFAGGSPLVVMRRHVTLAPGRPAGVPDALWGFLQHLSAKDPVQRPRSADEARRFLAAITPPLATLPPLPRLAAPPPPVALPPVAAAAAPTVVSAPTVSVRREAATERLAPLVAPKPKNWRLRIGVPLALLLAAGLTATGFLVAQNGGLQGTRAVAGPSVTSPAAQPSAPRAVASVTVTSSASPAATPVVVAATVPAVTGLPSGDALALLQAAGYIPVVNEIVRDDVADGVVLEQTPSAGSTPTSADVTLTVARRQSVSFLGDWKIVEGADPARGTATVNGKVYTHALWQRLFAVGGKQAWQYDLGRKFQKVTGEAGLTDTSDSDAVVRYEFLVDKRQVQTFDVKLGTTHPVEVDVSGGLRLEVIVTKIAGKGAYTYPTLGDAQIWALPGQVATPTKP